MPHFGSMLERTLRPPAPIDLRATLAPHLHGSGDPTMRFAPTGIWRATHTPDGPATIRLRREGSTAVRVSAWGSGAEWAIERSADLIGESDDPSPFEPRDRLLRELTRRLPGLRISRTNAVVEALVPAILEQKVTGEEAHRSFRRLAVPEVCDSLGGAVDLRGSCPDPIPRPPPAGSRAPARRRHPDRRLTRAPAGGAHRPSAGRRLPPLAGHSGGRRVDGRGGRLSRVGRSRCGQRR